MSLLNLSDHSKRFLNCYSCSPIRNTFIHGYHCKRPSLSFNLFHTHSHTADQQREQFGVWCLSQKHIGMWLQGLGLGLNPWPSDWETTDSTTEPRSEEHCSIGNWMIFWAICYICCSYHAVTSEDHRSNTVERFIAIILFQQYISWKMVVILIVLALTRYLLYILPTKQWLLHTVSHSEKQKRKDNLRASVLFFCFLFFDCLFV